MIRKHHGKTLVLADVHGVFGRIFTDFRESFIVLNENGEPSQQVGIIFAQVQALIMDVDDETGRLSTHETHSFYAGDSIRFEILPEELVTVEERNCEFLVRRTRAAVKTFTIDATVAKRLRRASGTRVTEVKVPQTLQFKPLLEAEEDLDLVVGDRAGTHATVLHALWKTVDAFQVKVM